IVSAGGVAGCGLLTIFHQQLADVLLGPEFREGSFLMPWIGAAYVLLGLYHVAARGRQAHEGRGPVTLTETIGALLAVVIGFSLIRAYGIWGAAAGVPLYYGMQLIMASYFAFSSIGTRGELDRQNRPMHGL